MLKKVLSLIVLCAMILPLICFSSAAEGEKIITDGLVSWFDGKQNTENGHDPDSLIWYDLVGDNDVKVIKNNTNYFKDDAYHLKSTRHTFPKEIIDVINGKQFTVELQLGDVKQIGSSYSTFINNDGGNDYFSLFLRVSGDYIEFKNGTNARPKVPGGMEYAKNSTITVTFKVGGSCCMYVDGILIGEASAKSSIGADGNLFFGHNESSKLHEADYKSMRFYNRALTKEEVMNNAKADGTFDYSYVPDPEFVTVAQPMTNIIGDICLSEYVISAAELEALTKAEVKPANAIFYTNKDLSVGDGKYANTFSTVEKVLSALDGKIIPTFYVKDKESASAVVDYLESKKIMDANIMSSDPEVVKHARNEYTNIRGIIDYTEKYQGKTVTTADLLDIRKTTVSSLARVAVLPECIATQDNVKYLNNRQITTWVSANGEVNKDAHAVTLLVSGAYGIVSDNGAEYIYNAANKYIGENSITRTPVIIGHRGIPGMMPENTIEGAIEAFRQGADVVEIDIYITTDGVLVINHDATTSKYNKKVYVENCTLAQLKELTFTHNGVEYRMPTLEEFFKEFKGKDCMLFIEIKSSKSTVVPALKKLIEQYDIYDQCAVITFEGMKQLDNLKNFYPEMPVGFLVSQTYTGSSMLNSIQKSIQRYNTSYNPSYSGHESLFVREAVMRGITTWPWTINGSASIYKYIMYGHSGITTDNANYAGKLTEKLTLSYEANQEGLSAGDSVDLSIIKSTYNHEELPGTNTRLVILDGADVASVSGKTLKFNKEGSVTVMATQTELMGSRQYTVYSQPITISTKNAPVDTDTAPDNTDVTPDNTDATPEETTAPTTTEPSGTGAPSTEKPKDGGNTVIIVIIVVAVVVVAGVVAFIIIKKKKS